MATAPLSLFNTPQQYQQQQWQQAQEQAKAIAEMSNQKLAAYGAAMGGTMLGNALPGLLGVEDPELVKIKDIQGMFRGVDRNDPESLQTFAKALADKGYAAEAEQAWQKAKELEKANAEIDKTVAETGWRKSEAVKNQAAADKDRAAITAAAVKLEQRKVALQAAGVNPQFIDGIASDDKTFESYLKRSGTKVVEADGRQKLVDENTGKLIADLGTAPDRSTRISVDARTQQESEFSKERGKLQAKTLGEWESAGEASRIIIPKLDSMIKANNSGQLYNGPQASVTQTLASLLNSADLLSEKGKKELSTSEVYDKYAKDLVFAELEGKLGANVSNTDRDFIEKRVPQLSTSPAARSELLAKFKELHQARVEKAKAATAHANKFNNLNDFNTPTTPKPTIIKLD